MALADQRRRAQSAVQRLVRAAPMAAGAVLFVAVLARLARISTAVPLALLAGVVVLLALVTWVRSRRRETTDAIAAAVDRDAALRGELRSAHWFERKGAGDDWTQFHIDRAADRAGGVDWTGLYPPVRAGRSWALSAVLAAAAVVLSVGSPGRYFARAIGVADAPIKAGDPTAAELEQKLTALLSDVAAGKIDAEASRATLEELKAMLAKMDPELQKKLAELMKNAKLGPEGGKLKDFDPKSLAQKGQGGTPDDLKAALDDMAERMGKGEKSAEGESDRPGSPSDQKAGEKGQSGAPSDEAQAQTAAQQAAAAQMSMQMVRESASEAGGAKMMMGGGMMGGDSRPGSGNNTGNKPEGVDSLLVAQALRKELVEAAADMQGKNVDKEDICRKTEQGKSSIGFSRVAAGAFEAGRADAPPVVPEARRPQVQRYFVRKK